MHSLKWEPLAVLAGPPGVQGKYAGAVRWPVRAGIGAAHLGGVAAQPQPRGRTAGVCAHRA